MLTMRVNFAVVFMTGEVDLNGQLLKDLEKSSFLMQPETRGREAASTMVTGQKAPCTVGGLVAS